MTSIYTRRASLAACAFIASGTGLVHAATFGQVEYTVHGDTITIDSALYRSSREPLDIPSAIEGKPVTAIAPYAFSVFDFRAVSIPASMRTIGEGAFGGCRYLESVVIPSGVTAIEGFTFSDCDKLTTVVIPSTVTRIEAKAFQYAEKLKSIDLPAGLHKIGEEAFSQCSSLSKAAIPSGVTSIGPDAFSGTALAEVKIPAGASLGDGIFIGCDLLKSVQLPAGLKTIPETMFFNCSGLRRINLPSSVNGIGKMAFAGSGLYEIEFGPNVREIGGSAFGGSELKEVTFGPKVQTIGDNAFAFCTGLKTVAFPKSVKSIGKNAFAGGNRGVGLSSAVFTGKAPTMGKDVFKDALPGFKVFLEDGATGYTTPRWEGYRIARPSPEIVVENPDGSQLVADEGKIVFGDVVTGGKGKAVTVTIRNVGIRNLTGIRAITKGGQFSNFSIANISKTTIKPGKTAKLRLVFQPKDQGLRNTTLRILSSDSDENPFDIKVTGRGLNIVK